MKIIDGKTKIVTWTKSGKMKIYCAKSVAEAKDLLPCGRRISSCFIETISRKQVLCEQEMARVFGTTNIILQSEKELTQMEKKWMKAWGYSPKWKESRYIKPKRNIFDCDIKIYHMGIQLPNGEKKGEQVVVRHKKQNGIMDVRAMLQNGSRLINCTCETTDGYSQQLTDSEMIALFGKENVITKEEKLKMKAEKKWENHCIKKGWEIRPLVEKYL